MQNKGLSSLQTGVMAVSAGVCVANIYFNQPILNNIAASFKATENEVGNVSVLTQVGYGAGLFFLTPLGDKVSRKNLVFCLQLLLIAALLCLTFANSLFLVCLMSLLTGIFAVSAQVILPMAASLATENRGKTVGIIFTGILVGILTARVFAGYITQWLGWRYVYGISAGLVLVIAIIFRWLVPDVKQQFTGNYLKLLSSTLLQVKRFALLRRTALLGALIFGIFCSFWTTVTFHLSGAPFHYRPDTIGLFGILAIGGALLAPAFGKLADKGNPARSQLLTVLLIIVGVLMIKLFAFSVISFIIAVLLLDVGVQATQVTNVATIYTLDPAAHSRINTVYMTSYFMGGAIGTFAGIRCWAIGGWQVVTWQMLLWSLLSLAVVLMGFKRKTAVQSAAY